MKNLIETAAGRKSADLVLKNCQIVNVYSSEIESGDIAIVDGKIVGIGSYDGDFIFDPLKDICKVAVIERHHETGKIGLGFLGGYGIKSGAVAISVAHDSHNIIVAGVNNGDMAFAVEKLIEMEGGMILVKNGKIISSLPLPIAGIMSDKSGEFIAEELEKLHEKAHSELGISKNVEPIMTLTFMSLSVIPEIKLTDRGLFDYEKFDFIDVEVSK